MTEEQALEIVQAWRRTAGRLVESGHYDLDDLRAELDYIEDDL
jgi:hypothetical protein